MGSVSGVTCHVSRAVDRKRTGWWQEFRFAKEDYKIAATSPTSCSTVLRGLGFLLLLLLFVPRCEQGLRIAAAFLLIVCPCPHVIYSTVGSNNEQ